MIRILTVLVFLSSFATPAWAQDAEPLGKSFYSVGYFGEKALHPGVQLSVSRSLHLSRTTDNAHNRFDLGFSLTGYVHARNHIGLRATPHLSLVHSTKKGIEYGVKADAGWMRRFYQGKVFTVDNDGEVRQKYLAGQNSFTYGVYLVLAKNWNTSQSGRLRLFAELGGFRETNYNGGGLLHPAVSLGVSRYLNVAK